MQEDLCYVGLHNQFKKHVTFSVHICDIWTPIFSFCFVSITNFIQYICNKLILFKFNKWARCPHHSAVQNSPVHTNSVNQYNTIPNPFLFIISFWKLFSCNKLWSLNHDKSNILSFGVPILWKFIKAWFPKVWAMRKVWGNCELVSFPSSSLVLRERNN